MGRLLLKILVVIILPASVMLGDDSNIQKNQTFNRIATFAVSQNNPGAEKNVAEIAAATSDGMTLVYTDSENKLIGFIDITNPANPLPAGTLAMGGEPTSVAILGNDYALAGVNTSDGDYVNPSGYLAIVDMTSNTIVRTIDMGGQPDCVTISPDGRYAAIAIENERDEDFGNGEIPQLPAGFLMVVDITGAPAGWTTRKIELTGIADLGPEDPEPEYVDINKQNIAAVTLQENNHIILVDLATGSIVNDFNAGTANIEDVDIAKNGTIETNGKLFDIPREPDAIAWINDGMFAIANEGDMYGGSRGFTFFTKEGNVVFDSFNKIEHIAAQIGQYPESRAGKKGTEPEGAEFASYGDDNYLFIGCERANMVAVYKVTHYGIEYIQVLPTGVGPEGLSAIPQRNLFVVATEEDDPEEPGIEATVSIYQLMDGPAAYPAIKSAIAANEDGADVPIVWTALSALAADLSDANIVYTVPDAAMKKSRIYKVDASVTPALIIDEIMLNKNGATVNYDLEGISVRPDGGFWLACEGKSGTIDNLLIKVDVDGNVIEEVGLPASVTAGMINNGFEGVTVVGSGDQEKVYAAFQRAWNNDPALHTRIGEYTPSTGEWRFFYYQLNAQQSDASGWVGLSEIVALGNDNFAVIERDKGWGPDALLKAIYTFSIAGLEPKTQEEGNFPVVTKTLAYDLVPDLQAVNGWTLEKVEGLTVAIDGQVYAVTDNDGLDAATGETQFFRLGDRQTALGQ